MPRTRAVRLLAAAATLALVPVLVVASGTSTSAVGPHHLRGTVSGEGPGVVGIELTLFQGSTYVTGAELDGNGSYDLTVPDDGIYVMRATVTASSVHRTEWYNDEFRFEDATPIVVSGGDVTLQPFVVDQLFPVSGKVRADGAPLYGSRVEIWTSVGDLDDAKPADDHQPVATQYADGAFFTYLPRGTYKVRYQGQGSHKERVVSEQYAPVWAGGSATYDGALEVHVPASSDLGTVTLTRGASLAGRVTDGPSGQPLRKIDVTVIDADGHPHGHVVTPNDGRWRIGHLAPGSYQVRTEDAQAHAYVSPTPTPVTVSTDQVVTGLDVALARAPAATGRVDLSGTVVDQAGTPERGVKVDVYPSSECRTYVPPAATAYTDLAGAYAVRDLAAGSYRLRYTDSYGRVTFDDIDTSLELVEEWNGDKYYCSDAPTVPRGSVVNTTLMRSAGFTGTVLDENGDRPNTNGAQVRVYKATEPDNDSAFTSAPVRPDGSYVVDNLLPGTYVARFADVEDRSIETWWDHVKTRDEATVITVSAGTMKEDIDGNLWTPVFATENPVITGKPEVGATLDTTNVKFTGRQLTYSFTWTAYDETDKATEVGHERSYVVQDGDVGKALTVLVEASGPDGSTSSMSERTARVTEPPPPPPPVHDSTASATAKFKKARKPARNRVRIDLLVDAPVERTQITGTMTVTEKGSVLVSGVPVVNGGAHTFVRKPTPGWHRYVVRYSGRNTLRASAATVRIKVPKPRVSLRAVPASV